MRILCRFCNSGIWLIFAGLTLAPATVARSSSANLRTALAGIRRQEMAFHNIQITAHYQSTVRQQKKPAMTVAGYLDLAITMENIPAGRFTVVVSKEVGHAVGGTSPYYVQSYKGAFNGRVAEMITTREGPLGGPLINPRLGGIWGKAPAELTTLRGCAGWTATIFGAPLEINPPHHAIYPPLSQLLATPWGKWHTHCTIVHSRNGKKWYELSRYFPLGRFVLRLNPRKGFSLVRLTEFYWHVDPKYLPKRGAFPPLFRHPCRTIVASNFDQPMSGVFYPRKVVETVFDPLLHGSGIIAVNTVAVSRIMINVSTKPDNYQMDFPAGTRVTDSSTGRVIQIGGTPKQQMKQIEKAVAAARKEVATQPARKGGGK